MNKNLITRTFNWWIDALASLFYKSSINKKSWKTVLQKQSDALHVYSTKSNKSQEIGLINKESSEDEIRSLRTLIKYKTSTNPKNILLRLSTNDVLQQSIQIPKAAKDVIEPVLRNQLQRILPWPENETRFGYRIEGPDQTAPDQLNVSIAATSQTILDEALQEASKLNLKPGAIDFASHHGDRTGILLFSRENNSKQKIGTRLRQAVYLLILTCAIIGGTGIYNMKIRQNQISQIDEQIATVRSHINSLTQSNSSNKKVLGELNSLVDRKINQPAAHLVIEALSRTLPTHSYLSELELKNQEARITGKSKDATALISLLENTAEFQDVVFSSPTNREGQKGSESFSITAKSLPIAAKTLALQPGRN